jgi:hypothetical protein
MRMKFKDWLVYKFPDDELIVGGSSVDHHRGGDAPVKHPIGIAPQIFPGFDLKLLRIEKNFNGSLCYHNCREVFADLEGRRRRRVLEILDRYDFMTTEGYSSKRGRKRQIEFNDFFKSLQNHKFCVSPQGNGIDCHRHYETLLAKGIPIIQVPDEEYVNWRWGTNSYMEKYDDLPVLWTNAISEFHYYTELSVEYLEEKYEEFLETEFDFSRMTKSYWREHSSNIDECMNYWEGKFK